MLSRSSPLAHGDPCRPEVANRRRAPAGAVNAQAKRLGPACTMSSPSAQAEKVSGARAIASIPGEGAPTHRVTVTPEAGPASTFDVPREQVMAN